MNKNNSISQNEYWDNQIRKIKKLSNKQLIDTINYRYENNLNDDDYIAELVRRRKATNKKIAIVEGEQFKLINNGEQNDNMANDINV